MSTRAQIMVVEEGWDENNNRVVSDQIMLYHHCDGYPYHILKTFKKAEKYILTQKNAEYYKFHLGRAGKVASYLCFVDPSQYEPEMSVDLHGDIAWFYKLFVTGVGKSAEWQVEIYKAKDDFWDNPCEENMQLFRKRSKLSSFFVDEKTLKSRYENPFAKKKAVKKVAKKKK